MRTKTYNAGANAERTAIYAHCKRIYKRSRNELGASDRTTLVLDDLLQWLSGRAKRYNAKARGLGRLVKLVLLLVPLSQAAAQERSGGGGGSSTPTYFIGSPSITNDTLGGSNRFHLTSTASNNIIAAAVAQSGTAQTGTLTNYFNVVDYGAVGDGVTDDANSIRAAIAAAGANGGGTVYFPVGTYLCTSNSPVAQSPEGYVPLFILPSNVRVLGESMDSTRIKVGDSVAINKGTIFSSDYYTTNLFIQNLTLDGNKSGRSLDADSYSTDNLIDLRSGKNLYVSDVVMINGAHSALDFAFATNAVAERCIARDMNGAGFTLTGRKAVLRDCQSTNCGFIQATADTERRWGAGIQLAYYAEQVEIIGHRSENDYAGINCIAVRGLTVRDSYFKTIGTNQAINIWLPDTGFGTNASKNVLISGNRIVTDGAQKVGIYLRGVEATRVTDNSFTNARVYLDGSISATIANNHWKGASVYKALVATNGTVANIHGNRFEWTGDIPISIGSASNVISDNVMLGCYAGFAIEATNATGNFISGNHIEGISGTSFYSAYLAFCTNNLFVGNDFGRMPIRYAAGNPASNVFIGNQMPSGVRRDVSGYGNRFQNNVMPVWDVWVNESGTPGTSYYATNDLLTPVGAMSSYESKRVLGMDSAGGPTTNVLAAPSAQNKYNLVLWGDSLTVNLWPLMLTNLGSDYRFQILGKGVNGEKSWMIAQRMTTNPVLTNWPAVIWAGANDPGGEASNSMYTNITAMVSALGSNAEYCVLGAICGTQYVAGHAFHTDFTNANWALAQLFTNHYLDVFNWLITNGTGTGQDLIDASNHVVPASLRTDNIHINTAGSALVAGWVSDYWRNRWAQRGEYVLGPSSLHEALRGGLNTNAGGVNYRPGEALYYDGKNLVMFTNNAANESASQGWVLGAGSQFGAAGISNAIGGNVGVGPLNQRSLTTGWQNTTVGNNSGYGLTSGYGNSAIGRASLNVVSTGYENSAGGASSLSAVTSGFGNSAWGKSAGTVITVGSYNTFIGHGANAYAGSNYLQYAGAIGAGVDVRADRSISIGRTVERIGFGTNSPQAKLHVVFDRSFNQPAMIVGDSNDVRIAVLETNGNWTLAGLSTATAGYLVKSNSALTPPTLNEGDNWYFSSNGIPHVRYLVGGVETTVRLVP